MDAAAESRSASGSSMLPFPRNMLRTRHQTDFLLFFSVQLCVFDPRCFAVFVFVPVALLSGGDLTFTPALFPETRVICSDFRGE
jgi:hypothetical protein